MENRTIAQRLFDGSRAQAEIEDELYDRKVPHEHLGWDHYDTSLEIHGVAPDWRIPDDLQQWLEKAGFSKIYVNHTDKWETHYNFWNGKEHVAPVEGWRVSYPHKRGDDNGSILVEKRVPTWPTEWFENGKVTISDGQ